MLRRPVLKKAIQRIQQQDLFDESANRWQALPIVCRQNVEQLLTQLFIQAIHQLSVIQKSGGDSCIPKLSQTI